MHNPYLELTEDFNQGRLRVLLSSGQAVVVHRLAIMSKDGDWIVREDDEAISHVLEVLARRGAQYRFGAPLDSRWLAGGWSAHLEIREESLRLRTDFVSRPPRIPSEELARMWERAETIDNPVVDLQPLAAIKLTNREKDYAVVGELARRMEDPLSQLLYSRSSRDLIQLAVEHPEAWAEASRQRPLLARVGEGRDVLDEELDRERRRLMRINEERLARYMDAAEPWAQVWPEVQREIKGLPLPEAHRIMVSRAQGALPFQPGSAGERHDSDAR
jgi:hypothetical protein